MNPNPLREKIEQEIRTRGPMPFSRYMELCLYEPELGYYSRNLEQFGKAGDFYTSSDVHAVFGRLMARQFEEMWRALGSPERVEVVELGAGRGLFAGDVLDWAEKKFPEFFGAMRYWAVEGSAALRARIAARLGRHVEVGRVVVEDGVKRALLPAGFLTPQANGQECPLYTGPTIAFANEFFDALPVEVIAAEGSLRVDLGEGKFVESWAAASGVELEFLDRYSVHPEPGERVEAPLVAQRYMKDISRGMERGFFVAIDYGYTREEQLAGRHRGTVKAIRRHAVSADAYEAPGEQDITADVNFTALAAVAKNDGMRVEKVVTQSQFLLGIGEGNEFADAFEDCRVPQERAKVALQLKHLVTPAGMGESFHALVASKGVAAEKVSALAGLSFGRAGGPVRPKA